MKLYWIAPFAYAIAGCASLPAFGPPAQDIVVAAESNISVEDEMTPYQLVNLSPATLPATPHFSSGFPSRFHSQSFLTDQERIAVSDRLELRIWEAATDGLFASNGQRETTMSIQVSNAGTIEIPYAGQISIAGLTTSQAREIILNRYQGQAIDPEINIQIIETGTRTATVIGATRTSGRATIPANGTRLLDLIAQMGGVPHPYWEVGILVSRGSTTGRVRMDHLRENTSNNIVILPNDTVQITHTARRFSVFGAVQQGGRIGLDAASPSLSDLLAEVGGLNDMQAAPNAVFVFRRAQDVESTPIVYRLDFARADSFLLADQFALHEADIIYVANANAREFHKFITTIVSPFLGGVANAQALGN